MFDVQYKINRAIEVLPKLKKLKALCKLCPQSCKVKRFKNEYGECGLGSEVFFSSSHLHFGEETIISGNRGSGTVFFSGCNLECLYCQNSDISQSGNGSIISIENLANRFLLLQEQHAHNINLVTPTPQVYNIVKSLLIAWQKGLNLPIVYNCGGYESLQVIRLLNGIVDVYLTDFKYGSNESGELSGVKDYTTQAKIVHNEMWKQVGTIKLGNAGTAHKGLIIRHLVLPGNLSKSERVLHWIASNLGTDVTISLMVQYHPSYKAYSHKMLSQNIDPRYYRKILNLMTDLGFSSGSAQDFTRIYI